MMTRISCLLLMAVFLLTGISWADKASKEDPQDKKHASEKESTKKTKIEWLKYDEGLALAKDQGKNVFLEFTAKWCGYCKRMRATTFKDPEVIDMLNKNYVVVTVDGESKDSLDVGGWLTTERGIARDFRVTGYPTFWFLTPTGEKITSVKGYRDTNTLFTILDYMKDESYKTITFSDFVKQKNKK